MAEAGRSQRHEAWLDVAPLDAAADEDAEAGEGEETTTEAGSDQPPAQAHADHGSRTEALKAKVAARSQRSNKQPALLGEASHG